MLWLLGIPVVLIVAAFLYLQLPSGPSTFRYKMTVEVMTPEGPRTGSAVRQIRFSKTMNGGNLAHVAGEAVAVDLPNGQTLFALLVGVNGNADHASQAMWHLFRELDQDVIELWPDIPQINNPRIPTPVPMLVTFGDQNDSASVKRLDPEDFGSVLGNGAALKRITVARTTAPVTKEIRGRLDWLSTYPEPSLKAGHNQRDFSLPATLKHGAFRQGPSK